MKRFLILAALLLTSGQASAIYYSSEYLQKLLDNCSSLPETFDASSENFDRVKDCGLSTGYILGVFDSLKLIADKSRCFPRTVESGQLVSAVYGWIQSHPERIHQAADKSVIAAINETWSCGD